MSRTVTKRLQLACACAALATMFAAAGEASALEVNNTSDSGPGSLRAAVAAGGSVTFAAVLEGQTITLISGAMTVPTGTTIAGPGADLLAVDAHGMGRIFDVPAGASVTISGLRLTDGSAGAGGQGGAIRNLGILVIDGLTVSANSAGDSGGGIYNAGTLDVRASTFSGNSVTDATCAGGGAIRSEGPGSVLFVTNSTISGNIAIPCSGGGVSFNDGSADIRASTIVGNTAGSSGGNLYKGSAAATLQLAASVVSDGGAGGGTPANTDLHGARAGGLVSGGYNLVRARGDAAGFVATDFANGTNPQLAALGNNGGPTATHALAVTSPLLDGGAATCAQATDQRGFVRPQGDACDVGAFEFRQNRLSVIATGGGSISAGAVPAPLQGAIANCATTCTAEYDGEAAPAVTLTATPDAGRLFSGWSGDCSGSTPTAAVTMDQARSCTATFMPDTVVVTPSAGPNGSLSPSTPQVVPFGSTFAFTVTPDANYHIDDVSGCGGSLSGNVFTTGVLTASCTVSASFAIDTHVVVASAGANGAIAPLQQTVDHGSVAVLTVTPDANYHVASVTGCGGVLNGTTYTTAPVTADCAVNATFAIDTHTVTATAGANGSIAPPTQEVDHGATATLTVTPAANYHIDDVTGCGGTLAGNTYTTAPVTADCTVTASFAIDTHTVTGTAGANGSIAPATQDVDHGEPATLTVTPDANHHIDSVSGCGGTLAGNTYTTAPVTADCAVTATFAIDTFTVDASAGPNGSITPATQEVDYDTPATLTVTPDAHYHIDAVEGCGGTLAGNTYTTAPVTADCSVTASFAIDTHTIGGSVSDLAGSGLVLRLNGGEDLPVAGNGPFVFATPVDSQADYAVTIGQQPDNPAQVCSVANGDGTVGDDDVTDVLVSCVDALPDLTLQVDDGRDYVRYGMLVDYVVTLHNAGNGDSGMLTLAGVASPAVDSAFIRWHCFGAGAGATCTADGNGPLVDTSVRVPPGRTLTWLVTAPVRFFATEGNLDYTFTANGAAGSASAADTDTLVVLRTGFDVQDDDGASSIGSSGCAADAVATLDLAATHRFEWPTAPAARAVEVLLHARDAAGTGFRLERLGLDDGQRVRVVTIDRAGVERAGEWTSVVEPALMLGGIRSADGGHVLLVEGTRPALAAPLPAGSRDVLRIRTPASAAGCD